MKHVELERLPKPKRSKFKLLVAGVFIIGFITAVLFWVSTFKNETSADSQIGHAVTEEGTNS